MRKTGMQVADVVAGDDTVIGRIANLASETAGESSTLYKVDLSGWFAPFPLTLIRSVLGSATIRNFYCLFGSGPWSRHPCRRICGGTSRSPEHRIDDRCHRCKRAGRAAGHSYCTVFLRNLCGIATRLTSHSYVLASQRGDWPSVTFTSRS